MPIPAAAWLFVEGYFEPIPKETLELAEKVVEQKDKETGIQQDIDQWAKRLAQDLAKGKD